LRHGEWREINFENAEWNLTAGKMKNKPAPHLLPVSKQTGQNIDRD